MRRSDQRRDAVFALYARQVRGGELDDILNGAKPFTRQLAHGAAERVEQLDAEIGRLAQGWTLDRIAPLELNILRVALYEMRYREDVPTAIAIDEAVGFAREYCGADAPGFVNGILGAAAKEIAPQEGAA